MIEENKNYEEQLKDPRWQRRRCEILVRDDFTCQMCGSKEKSLHVHHISYLPHAKAWEYKDDLLITLCCDCHEEVHRLALLEKEADELEETVLRAWTRSTQNRIRRIKEYISGLKSQIKEIEDKSNDIDDKSKLKILEDEWRHLKYRRDELYYKIISDIDYKDGLTFDDINRTLKRLQETYNIKEDPFRGTLRKENSDSPY